MSHQNAERHRLDFRGLLFLIFAAVVFTTIAGAGLYLEPTLRHWLNGRIEQQLLRYARVGSNLIELAAVFGPRAVTDDLADRLGEAGKMRVTVIAADGTVLGDSQLAVADLRAVENHRDRPEVRAALQTGYGAARRYSYTLETNMLYVAVPYHRAENQACNRHALSSLQQITRDGCGRGVLRVAMPLQDVDRSLARLRTSLAVAAVIGLLAALLMSLIVSYFPSRELRRLLRQARRVTGSEDEVGNNATVSRRTPGVARSFNDLAAELSRSVTAVAGERDRLATILQGLGEAVVVLNGTGQITLINAAAEQLFGFAEPAVGRLLTELVEQRDLDQLVERLARETAPSCEFSLTGPPHRHLLARATRPKLTEGSVIVMADVTEIRRVERVRRDFIANVSHELRTPVSVIRANAETLLEGALDDPEQAQTFVAALMRNAERLSVLIRDLLDLTRIESGQAKLILSRVPVARVVKRAIDNVQRLVREKRLRLVEESKADLWVWADESALEQVLTNLLDNAAKYTTVAGEIRIQIHSQPQWVTFEVHDSGPGIEQEQRGRVFERFYRVDAGRSREVGGSGIGLAIVKNLVEAMRGTVGVRPAAPHGSLFWFILPIAPSALEEEQACVDPKEG